MEPFFPFVADEQFRIESVVGKISLLRANEFLRGVVFISSTIIFKWIAAI